MSNVTYDFGYSAFGEKEIEAVRAGFAKARTDKCYRPGKWFVSYMNFLPEVVRDFKLPKRVNLVDMTLTKTEQMTGATLSTEAFKTILKALDDIGVPQIRLMSGTMLSKESLSKVADTVDSLKADVIIEIGYRKDATYEQQIDDAASVGVDYVKLINGPSPAWERAYRGRDIGKTLEEVCANRVGLVEYAKDKGVKTILLMDKCAYVDWNYLKQLFEAVVRAGVNQLYLADHGGFTPTAWKYLVKKTKDAFPNTSLGIHFHNSFGNSTAVSTASVEAGADTIEVTVNAVGNALQADLAETAMQLEALYGINTGVKLEKLKEVYDLVRELTGFSLWDYRPFMGDRYYEISCDAIVLGTVLDPYCERPCLPATVGNKDYYDLGIESGPQTLALKLKSMGKEIDKSLAPLVLAEVKRHIMETKRPISDERLLSIIEKTKLAKK
jgi:isopropylmalate/homocitrate/citramalate synthase